MKKALILMGGLLIASLLQAQELKTENDSISYSLGILMGKNLKSQGFTDINLEVMSQAMKALLNDEEPKLNVQQAQGTVSTVMKKKEKLKYQKNIEEGKAFLAANAEKEGVITLESGLQYTVLTEGAGPVPQASDKVKVHYHGTLLDGNVFDSSVQRGEPATFGVTQVIQGWVEALQLMPVGSKWRLFIPSDLAYGERSAGPKIGPYSTLIFEVELLGIQ